MRIDDFLSTVGVVKRRTIAKQLGSSGMIAVNGITVKASYQVKIKDIIHVKGSKASVIEVLDIPKGSVQKDKRGLYFTEIKN